MQIVMATMNRTMCCNVCAVERKKRERGRERKREREGEEAREGSGELGLEGVRKKIE